MGRGNLFEERLLFAGEKQQQAQKKSGEGRLIHEGVFIEIGHFIVVYSMCCLLNELQSGNERAPFTHPASLRSLALSSAGGKEGEKGMIFLK